MGKVSSDFKELTDAAGEEGAKICWKITKATERSSTTEVHYAGLLLQALMPEQPQGPEPAHGTRERLSVYLERLTQAQELLEPLQPHKYMCSAGEYPGTDSSSG